MYSDNEARNIDSFSIHDEEDEDVSERFSEKAVESVLAEAEAVEYDFVHRFNTNEFWTNEFNVYILQKILDVKYNHEPGWEYEADISYNTMPRLMIVCLCCCNVELNSYSTFKSHNDGKQHKKNRFRALQEYEYDDGGRSEVRLQTDSVSVLKLKSLSEPLGIFPVGSLEYEIDNSAKPIIGVTFVFKESFVNEFLFSCQLCATNRISREEMLSHLQGFNHSYKCIESLYGKTFQTKAELKSEMFRIVSREGRINNKVPHLRSLPLGDDCKCK